MLNKIRPYFNKDSEIDFQDFRYYIADFWRTYKKSSQSLKDDEFSVENFFDFNISTFISFISHFYIICVYNYNGKKLRFFTSGNGYEILNSLKINDLNYVGYSESCEYFLFESDSNSDFVKFVIDKFPNLILIGNQEITDQEKIDNYQNF